MFHIKTQSHKNRYWYVHDSVSHRPDYVAWVGSGSLARGPDPSLRGPPSNSQGPPSNSQGPDPCLRKGPNRSLAKGSIYSRLAMLSLAESRGK